MLRIYALIILISFNSFPGRKNRLPQNLLSYCLRKIGYEKITSKDSRPYSPIIDGYQKHRNLRKIFPHLPPLAINHIRYDNGTFRVLIPQKDGTFKVFVTVDQNLAKLNALQIKERLNLNFIRRTLGKELNAVEEELQTLNLPSSTTTKTRIKSFQSLKTKIFDRASNASDFKFSDVDDVIAGRITTSSFKESEDVLKQLEQHYQGRIKDIDIKDKESGYRAIHVQIETPNAHKFEIQINSLKSLSSAKSQNSLKFTKISQLSKSHQNN